MRLHTGPNGRREVLPIHRRHVAIASFVAAALALLAIVASLRAVSTWRFYLPRFGQSSFIGLGFNPTPGRSASKSVSAQGVQRVEIEAPIGSVSVSTGSPTRFGLHWTVSGNPAGAVTTSLAGGVLTIRFAPNTTIPINVAQLSVTMPGGLPLGARVGTGTLSVQGAIPSLSATVQTGALKVIGFTGSLSAVDHVGPMSVQNATIKGPLSLVVGTGPLNFSGDPGLAATITDQLGPINLNITPSGQLAVRAQVPLGPFASGFPGLSTGTNGTFRGTIGGGKPGYLRVTDQTGPVNISPF